MVLTKVYAASRHYTRCKSTFLTEKSDRKYLDLLDNIAEEDKLRPVSDRRRVVVTSMSVKVLQIVSVVNDLKLFVQRQQHGSLGEPFESARRGGV